MITRFNLFFIIVLFGLETEHSFAQSNTVSSGGDANGTGGTVSYSIGQIDYTTKTGTNGTITEGLQQPYEITIITGVQNNTIQLAVSAYPNPVVDQLVLNINQTSFINVFYILTDVSGKLITENKISDTHTEIQFKELAQGIYFIKVISANKEVKVFKIIKN